MLLKFRSDLATKTNLRYKALETAIGNSEWEQENNCVNQ